MSSPDPGYPDSADRDRAGESLPPTHQSYGDPYPNPASAAGPDAHGQPPYGPTQYGQAAYGQGQYGQPQYGQAPYGQPGYGPPPYGATPGSYGYPPANEGLATASMIIGIVSLALSCFYGFGLLGSPAALVMGRISLKRIDASNGQLGGRGMAQAGLILGIIGTVLLVLAIIVLVVIIVVAANGGFDDGGASRY